MERVGEQLRIRLAADQLPVQHVDDAVLVTDDHRGRGRRDDQRERSPVLPGDEPQLVEGEAAGPAHADDDGDEMDAVVLRQVELVEADGVDRRAVVEGHGAVVVAEHVVEAGGNWRPRRAGARWRRRRPSAPPS